MIWKLKTETKQKIAKTKKLNRLSWKNECEMHSNIIPY